MVFPSGRLREISGAQVGSTGAPASETTPIRVLKYTSPLPDGLPIKLQIARQTGASFEVRALETPMMGEPHAASRLPLRRR